MRVLTPIGAADDIARLQLVAWPDPQGHPAGFPNFPQFVTVDGTPVEDLGAATHLLWDGNFTAVSAWLLECVGEHPERVPLDVSGLSRDDVLALFEVELAAKRAASEGGA